MSSPTSAMGKAELISMLPGLRKELEEARERAQQAAGEVEALKQVIRGIENLAGGRNTPLQLRVEAALNEDEPEPDEGPRGQEAVRMILEEAYPGVLAQSEIARRVIARGWIAPGAKTPQAAIRAAAHRLAASGGAVMVGTGFRAKAGANGG